MSNETNWAAHYGAWPYVIGYTGYVFCVVGLMFLFSTSREFGIGLIVFGGVLVFSSEMRKAEIRSEIYFAGLSASLRHIHEVLEGRKL